MALISNGESGSSVRTKLNASLTITQALTVSGAQINAVVANNTGASSGTNTGDQLTFKTIAVAGQSDIVAETITDTLTIVAGANITLTTNAATDTLTITATGGAGATAFNDIGNAAADGAIDNTDWEQTLDWSTITTTTAWTIGAAALTTGKLISIGSNSLTSGTLLELVSAGTGALSNQTGLKISLTGTNGTASQTSYGIDILNSHVSGTSSFATGIKASVNGSSSAATGPLAAIFIGSLGGGWKFGNYDANSGTIYSNAVVTPSATNYTLLADSTSAALNSTSEVDLSIAGTRVMYVTAGAVGIGGYASSRLLVVGTNTSGATLNVAFNNSSAAQWQLYNDGAIVLPITVTAAGTTGNQTINKISGTVNIAAAGSSVTVTNSLVTVNSIISVELRTNDSTARIANYVCSAGSFVINLTAAATAEVSIGFVVLNKAA